MASQNVPNNWETAANEALANTKATAPAPALVPALVPAPVPAPVPVPVPNATVGATKKFFGIEIPDNIATRLRLEESRKKAPAVSTFPIPLGLPTTNRNTESLRNLIDRRFPLYPGEATQKYHSPESCGKDFNKLPGILHKFLAMKSETNKNALLSQLRRCIALRFQSHLKEVGKGNVQSDIKHRKIILRFIEMYDRFYNDYERINSIEYIEKSDKFIFHYLHRAGGKRTTRKSRKQSRKQTRRRR
jgi:hypothetical protein